MTGALDFVGKLAVITGAASGIGRSTAELLLCNGAAVLATDLELGEGLDELRSAGAQVLACDVTSHAERHELIEAAGECDFLVNSAGIIRLPAISEATESDWERVFDVNAKAVFFLCQELGPRLRPGGGIVNISSVAARNAVNTETGVYAASKAAVLSITRTFAHVYVGAGVRVNAVVPGVIDTPMQDYVVERISTVREANPDDIRARRVAGIPLGRPGSASECAKAILWLLSPASSYLTGQAIAVDGGMTML